MDMQGIGMEMKIGKSFGDLEVLTLTAAPAVFLRI
jgi:hypothetical protein